MNASDPNATHPRGQIVGYLRVSAIDQNEARQLDGVAIDRTFTDRASGKDTQRPELERMRLYVREGDVVLVHSMDRLARNLDDLRRIVHELTGRGVQVRFLRENLTFTGEDSPISHLLLSVLGAVAQFERDLIRERQREGIAIARARGAYKGKRPLLNREQAAALGARVAAGESPTELAQEYGIHRQSVYRYAARAQARAAAL